MNNNGRISFQVMKIEGDLGNFTRLSDSGVWINNDTGEVHFKDHITKERKQNPEKYFLIVNINPDLEIDPDLESDGILKGDDLIQEIILAESLKDQGFTTNYQSCYLFQRRSDLRPEQWQWYHTTAVRQNYLNDYCLEYRELDEKEYEKIKEILLGNLNSLNIKLTMRKYGEELED